MTQRTTESNGATRVAYILGVPLADDVERQWPQMGEVVRGARLVAEVEGNFPELTLEVGRRLHLDGVVVVEWTCNYGDGRLYRNVTIGELQDGEAIRVTDYWGEPAETQNGVSLSPLASTCPEAAPGPTMLTSRTIEVQRMQ